MNSRAEKLIEHALAYLAEEQALHGYFPGLTFSLDDIAHRSVTPTPFLTALIVHALEVVKEHSVADTIIGHATDFLKAQVQPDGSWNYWLKESAEYTSTPSPADMDDTAVILSAIIKHEPSYFTGAAMADVAHLLTAVEVQEGGPYNTWIIDFKTDTRWHDVDVAVNANIASLLSLLEIELPQLTDFFDHAISEELLSSLYYHSPIVILYFLSRSYTGQYRQECIEYLWSAQHDGYWQNPLMTAMALSALARFGASLSDCIDAVQYIAETAVNGTHWEAQALYIDRITGSEHRYCGSIACTTGMCIEALALFLQSQRNTLQEESVPFSNERARIIAEYLHAIATDAPLFLPFAEQSVAQLMKHPLLSESMILPYHFAAAYGEHSIDDNTLYRLGLANLYGWVGYTIVDNCMDGQFDKELLPFSTYCIRQLVRIYRGILPKESYQIVEAILSQTDLAYMQEYHARLEHTETIVSIIDLSEKEMLPTYQKSLGHALPALSILLLEGHHAKSTIVQNVTLFFQHYLHARQYSDDAHDILEDLTAGQLTHALHDTLSYYKLQYPTATTIDLARDETALLEVFWRDVFPLLYDTMHSSALLAKRALTESALHDSSYFSALIDTVLESGEKALRERRHMYEFLDTY